MVKVEVGDLVQVKTLPYHLIGVVMSVDCHGRYTAKVLRDVNNNWGRSIWDTAGRTTEKLTSRNE